MPPMSTLYPPEGTTRLPAQTQTPVHPGRPPGARCPRTTTQSREHLTDPLDQTPTAQLADTATPGQVCERGARAAAGGSRGHRARPDWEVVPDVAVGAEAKQACFRFPFKTSKHQIGCERACFDDEAKNGQGDPPMKG